MNARIGLLAVWLIVLSAAGAGGHSGKTHVMGTVTALDAKHVVVKSREGPIVSIGIAESTEFRSGDSPAAASDLKVGDRVVVDAVGKGADLTATEIRFASRSAAPAHGGEHGQGGQP